VDTPGVWSLDSLDTRHDATACNEFQSELPQSRHPEGHHLDNDVQTSLVGRVRLEMRLASVAPDRNLRVRRPGTSLSSCAAIACLKSKSRCYTKSYIPSLVACLVYIAYDPGILCSSSSVRLFCVSVAAHERPTFLDQSNKPRPAKDVTQQTLHSTTRSLLSDVKLIPAFPGALWVYFQRLLLVQVLRNSKVFAGLLRRSIALDFLEYLGTSCICHETHTLTAPRVETCTDVGLHTLITCSTI
jgi:hypothetical protein